MSRLDSPNVYFFYIYFNSFHRLSTPKIHFQTLLKVFSYTLTNFNGHFYNAVSGHLLFEIPIQLLITTILMFLTTKHFMTKVYVFNTVIKVKTEKRWHPISRNEMRIFNLPCSPVFDVNLDNVRVEEGKLRITPYFLMRINMFRHCLQISKESISFISTYKDDNCTD